MTRGAPHPDGKVLIIGGGIANFTNVADTFKGIARALKEVYFIYFILFYFLEKRKKIWIYHSITDFNIIIVPSSIDHTQSKDLYS